MRFYKGKKINQGCDWRLTLQSTLLTKARIRLKEFNACLNKNGDPFSTTKSTSFFVSNLPKFMIAIIVIIKDKPSKICKE